MTEQPPPDPVVEPMWRRFLAGARGLSWSWLARWVGFGWMVVVLLVGLPMVARIMGVPVSGEAFSAYWTEQFVRTAALVYAVVLVPSLVVWLLRRDLALPIGLIASLAVLLNVGHDTGSLPAVAVVAVQTLLAWFIGLGLVGLVLKPGAAGVSVLGRTVLAFAAGNGLLGLAYLGLGSFGQLAGPSIAVVSVLLVVLSAIALVLRGGLGVGLPRLYAPSFLELVLVAGGLAFATFALLHAYVPEVLSDAVREHLPITREIWQDGSVGEFLWWTSRQPIHAQLITAPAWAVGGSAGVALSHGVVGLVTALGSGALAGLLAGRRAAAIAFAAFISAPLVLWEVGHSYVDLYPAMFAIAAAIAVVTWQRVGHLPVLLLAGLLAGLAFAAKGTAAAAMGALGLAVLLIGRERFSLRSRLAAGLTLGVGGLLVLPWLWRSYQITGQFPVLDLVLSSVLGEERFTGSGLANFGLGRGPLDLLAIPWAVTYQGEVFGQNGAGALGLLLLMAVPLVVFAPRTRSLAFVLVMVGLGALAWAFTAQYLRYAMPLVAVLAALAGVGASSLAAAFERRGPRPMGTVVTLVVIVAVALAPLVSLPARRNQVPLEFYTGQLDGASLVAGSVPSYEFLQATSDVLGDDDRLFWLGSFFGGIYTEAHASPLRLRDLGQTDEDILRTLDEHGVEYLGWELDATSARQFGHPLVSPLFLRGNSELVATHEHTYLFRIGEELGWEQGPQLLPALGAVGPEEDWIPRGEVVVAEEGVLIPSGGNIKATAPVEPGATYIVRVRGACEESGGAIVSVLWKNADSVTVGRDRQRVSLPEDGPTFIITKSPESAASAVIHVSPYQADCTFSRVSLRELLNAPAG